MPNKKFPGSRAAWAAALLCAAAGAVLAGKGEKLKPEELVARHLESLGPPEARAALKPRAAEGKASLRLVREGSSAISGPAVFFSERRKVGLSIQFNFATYPEEQFAFDGQKAQVRRIRPENRSKLGEFLFVYHQIMSEGLIGGTLCAGWPLLELEERQPGLKYGGLDKVGDRKLHELKYQVRKGAGDLKISLYFDPETYQHLRTVYQLEIRYGMRANPGDTLAAQEAVTRYKLEEDFTDFRQVDGLTLPAQWRIRLTTEGSRGEEFGTGGVVWEWHMIFDKIIHNEPIDPRSYSLE